MSFLLDQRAYSNKGLLRSIRAFVCGHPHFDDARISQGSGGSVGAGEIFAACGPTARTGRLRLRCTTGGGAGAAQFSADYINDNASPSTGSPPLINSPQPSPLYPAFSTSVVADEQYEANDVWIFIETSVNWVVGNFIDIDIIPSPNTTPWTERAFVTDSNLSPAFDPPSQVEWTAQGPGSPGVSPLSNVTVGLRSNTSVAATRYNLEHKTSDSFNPSSPATVWDGHPNASGSRYSYYNDAPMDYWITCNGRRFVWAVRLNTGVWQGGYMGFFLPWAGDVSYPYPMVCGACGSTSTFNAATTDRNHSMWFDPVGDQTGGGATSIIIREPAGIYRGFQNAVDGGASDDFVDADIDDVIWPFNSSVLDENAVVRRYIQNMSRTIRYQLGTSPDPELRGYLPRQTYLFSQGFAGGASQTLGMLDGVFHMTNEGGAAGGDSFSFESPEVTYLLVQNTFRGNRDNFAAIRMDPD